MKKILLFFFFVLSSVIYSQQTICFGETKTYTVDIADGPTGTIGSIYDWSVSTPGFTGTITENANSATINWSSTPAGIYFVEVLETNNGCIGQPVTLIVTINPLPAAPTLSVDNAAICYDGDAVFTINGLPNATIVFNINSGGDASITLDSSGSATFPVTNSTEDLTFTITQIQSSNGCVLNGLSISQTVLVNPLVTTSPIGF